MSNRRISEEAQDRRARTRRAREERHGGGREHNTRTCPSCRRSLPYLDPVQDPPRTCPDCGYRWDCPECGHEIPEADRDDAGNPPAFCSICDAEIPEGVASTDDTEDEAFEWSDR